MAEEYGFFNAMKDSKGNYDRVYEASSFSNFFSNFIGNGVYYNPTNQLKVVASSGLSITVRKGKAFINGYWYKLTEDTTLVISANETANVQTVVVTCTLDLSQRLINIGYRKGDSTPIRTGTKYELVLAVIQLGVGVSSITNSMIKDKRPDSNYCGYVTNILGEIDFTETFEQFEDEFDTWFDGIKNKLSTDQAGNLQLQIDDLEQKNDEHEEKITNHEEKITNHEEKITNHEEKITNLETKMSGLLDFFYPVGTIYETENLSFDPNKEWGGSWKRIKGRVLVGVDEEDRNFNAVEKTGGYKTVNISHIHGLSNARAGVGRSSAALGSLSYVNGGNPHNVTFDRELAYDGGIQGVSKSASDTARIYGNTDSGGSTTLSILPPYITCYMWKRVG